MTEFRDRMALQRQVLQIVNRCPQNEELFGLSAAAIARWVSANQINPTSEAKLLICDISEKLLFIANRSQEQVSTEYRELTNAVNEQLGRLDALVI
jgi:hypothetical protein